MTSTIKVNNIQNQCGANIINESSNTITIGASGDTIALASGASQTGFGRTGTVDWQTGSIKTATFTAANGEGYFANTSGGAFTMNLPAGSAGAIVSVVDYTNTFQTNNLTISPNGSEKIGGVAANFIASTEGQSLTFVYVDGTEGWKNVQDSTSNAIGNPYVIATGGTITECGNYKIHTFTGPGTFTVCQVASCSADNTVDYLVVAGGGGGGGNAPAAGTNASGAGAGGFRFYANTTTNPQSGPAGPINNFPSGTTVTVTATAFPITVGAGGSGSPGGVGCNGSNSIFSTITSAGGGGGGGGSCSPSGANGGSGGGSRGPSGPTGGSGNTPPVSPPQGNPGGSGAGSIPDANNQAGGGGALAAGGGTPNNPNPGGVGGAGGGVTGFGSGNGECSSCVQYFAGGGGGATGSPGGGAAGGLGGGGQGGSNNNTPRHSGEAGTTNTGGGGGGGTLVDGTTGGNGGSGIVVIRYRFQ